MAQKSIDQKIREIVDRPKYFLFPMNSSGRVPNISPYHWILLTYESHTSKWVFYNSLQPENGEEDVFFEDAMLVKNYVEG